MECLDGDGLGHLLENQSLSVEEACSLLQPVAEALRHVHDHEIVHRDVNPSNILFSDDGAAKLIDFSIALGPNHAPLGSGTLCTPAYMSPEQRRGGGTDPRSDIFSFGIVLYEALTGQKPFGTWTNREKEVSPPRTLDPVVPAELSDVVMRCLERDPDRRIQSARVLTDALAVFADGSVEANVDPTSQSSQSRTGAHTESSPDMNNSTSRARNVDPTTAIGFLESRPEFARSIISRWATVPVRMLRAHPDFWDWDALSRNENLSWSASLLHEYAHKWDWAALSANEAIPFAGDLIERHQRRWDWELLSVNEALPWTADLIRRFSDRWPWGSTQNGPSKGALSMNRALPWSAELLNEFEHRWDWRILSGNSTLPWSTELLQRHRERWEWGHQKWKRSSAWGMVRENGGLEYPTLSSNPGIPWSEELIRGYSEILSWTELSVNPALPWSKSMLDRYKERWSWDTLSANEGLPWSYNLLDRHDEKWDWRNISCNESIPWNDHLFNEAWKRADSYDQCPGGCGGYGGLALSKNQAVPWDIEKSKRIVRRCRCALETLKLNKSPILFPSSVLRRFHIMSSRLGKYIGPVHPEGSCWELNPSLWWSREIMENFNPRNRSWKFLAANRGIPWSAALLLQFDEKFFPDHHDHQSVLVDNDQVWHRAFAPAVTEDVLRRLVREA